MAELKTAKVLQASNESRAMFTDFGHPNQPNPTGDCIYISTSWPLAEFDELVEFVKEHRENLARQAEMQTEE